MRKYIYLDETGNFDFRLKRGATKYFAIGSIVVDGDLHRAAMDDALSRLRHDLIWEGHPLYQGFHANPDSVEVRRRVYATIAKLHFRFDLTLLEKRKARPEIRATDELFYKYAIYYHLRKLVERELEAEDEVVVMAASIGEKRKRQAYFQAVKDVVQQCVPTHEVRTVMMRDEVVAGLQVADYCAWGLMRDLEEGDPSYRSSVVNKRSEFDLFAPGTTYYY